MNLACSTHEGWLFCSLGSTSSCDPFPEVAACRQQRSDLDGRELRSGVDEHPNRRPGLLKERVPEPLVRNQPPDEQFDTPLCHVCPPSADH